MAPPTRGSRSELAIGVAAGLVFATQILLMPASVTRPQVEGFQRDSQSLVAARIVLDRRDGPGSAGGLTGSVKRGNNAGERLQYRALRSLSGPRSAMPIDGFLPYRSHPGGNGWLFSALSWLLGDPGLPALRGAAALLSSAAVSVGVVSAHRIGGWLAAAVFFAAMLLAPWPNLFAPNLWWCLWALYLPLFVTAYAVSTSASARATVALALAAGLAKVLFTGFEFVTASLIAAWVPIAYVAVRDRSYRAAMTRSAAVAAGLTLAIALGLTLVVAQNALESGSVQVGVDHLLDALAKRSHGNPEAAAPQYREALKAPVAQVMRPYVTELTVLSLRGHPLVPAWVWLLGTLGLGVGAMARRPSSQARGAVAATAVALLASVSWFVVFPAHAAIHQHMDGIVWYLPAFPMSAILLGTVIDSMRTRS